ncbi:MAG: pentapeptide repeat-containing protein [Symploca sp. SIO3C6]|nr:pentapeptide repeat-containing protein [Symploca sp. SIO3C6]
MSDEEFIQEAQDLIKRVVEAETTNFLEIAEIADISLKEDLVGANLGGFDLSNGDFSNANLSNTNLSNTNLSYANLTNANLNHANLTNANLSHANLTNANFSYADLSNANLVGANLLTANIDSTILKETDINPEYRQQSLLVLSYLSSGDSLDNRLNKVNQTIAILSAHGKDTTEVEKFKNSVTEEMNGKESDEIAELFKSYLERCQTIEETTRVFEYRHEIEEIEQSYIACKQASEWLSNHRTEVVAEARRLIVDNQLEIEDFNKVEVSLEQVEKFCQSINIYLLWIENYITDGVVPTPLPKEIMTLVLPTEYYVKVLEAIKDHNISTENGLSSQAVYELRGYFKRFLIQGLKKYS